MRGATHDRSALTPIGSAAHGDRRPPHRVRDRRPRRRRRRRRPDRAVVPLVRRGGRGGVTEPNAFALGTVDAAGFPQSRDGARPRRRRARLRLLHQLRVGEERASWRRDRQGHRCCSPGCSCTARCASSARSSGSGDEESDEYFATRPRGIADRRVGLAAVASRSPIGPRSRRCVAEIEATLRRRRRAPPAALGRLAPGAAERRAVAGPPQPPARPPAVHPRRRELDDPAPRAVRDMPRSVTCLARWRSLGLAALGQSAVIGEPPAHCAGRASSRDVRYEVGVGRRWYLTSSAGARAAWM